jgi:hypothetical protein
MLNTNPRRPLSRIVAVLAGLAIFGWGLRGVFWQPDLHYRNWFGELAFGPFAILFAVLIIFGALFKPEIFGNSPTQPRR